MKKSDVSWKNYEQVSVYLLDKLSDEFGLRKVEGKQRLVGESGTEWEVDAKGVRSEDDGIVIIECRKYTKSKQNQEKIAGLAWRIKETGAKGGIIVSHLGLQKGAKLVAKAANIVSVIIDANSTPQNFTVEFLNKVFLGSTLSIGHIKGDLQMSLSRKCIVCGNAFLVKDNEIICPICGEKNERSLGA